MALPYHSIENACAPVAAGIWAVSFIDPQDLAVKPAWNVLPSIPDLQFKVGKAAYHFANNRLTARLLDKTDTRQRPGDFYEYTFQAQLTGITPTIEYLRAILRNRRVHLVVTFADTTKRFIPNVRLSADSDSGSSSNKIGYSWSGSVQLLKPAPFLNGTFDIIGGPYVPPSTTSGVTMVTITTSASSYTYEVPADKLLAYIWVKSDEAQTVNIGTTDGGSELGGPTDIEADQAALFGSGLLRPEAPQNIFFTGLSGANTIEIWLLNPV